MYAAVDICKAAVSFMHTCAESAACSCKVMLEGLSEIHGSDPTVTHCCQHITYLHHAPIAMKTMCGKNMDMYRHCMQLLAVVAAAILA